MARCGHHASADAGAYGSCRRRCYRVPVASRLELVATIPFVRPMHHSGDIVANPAAGASADRRIGDARCLRGLGLGASFSRPTQLLDSANIFPYLVMYELLILWAERH